VSGVVQLAPVLWSADAVRLGFEANSRGEWVRNGSVLRCEGSWLTLERRRPSAAGGCCGLLGTAGLWRTIRRGELSRQPSLAPVFDLPPLLSRETEPSDRDEHTCAALLEWAEATAEGSAPSGWTPPRRDEVEEWIEPGRRYARSGAWVAEVRLVVDPTRFALEISPLVRIPPELPQARAAWLEVLCQDVQQRWRMVRFGVDRAAGSVRAEVDLTGAPSDRVHPLIELGLAALTCSAAWALPSFVLASDPTFRSRMLDSQPRWVSPRLTEQRGANQ
jgi:hypothetical protein